MAEDGNCRRNGYITKHGEFPADYIYILCYEYEYICAIDDSSWPGKVPSNITKGTGEELLLEILLWRGNKAK